MKKRQEILKKVENFFLENIPKSRLKDNGSKEDYLTHIYGTRKYGLELGKEYKGDLFIIEIAASLHDVGADARNEHAHQSATISKRFLITLNIPQDILNKILKCIERHTIGSTTENIEEQIIQDADGLIFIEDNFKSYYHKRRRNLSINESKKVTTEKVMNMYEKIKTPKGMNLAKKFLKKALNDIKTLE